MKKNFFTSYSRTHSFFSSGNYFISSQSTSVQTLQNSKYSSQTLLKTLNETTPRGTNHFGLFSKLFYAGLGGLATYMLFSLTKTNDRSAEAIDIAKECLSIAVCSNEAAKEALSLARRSLVVAEWYEQKLDDTFEMAKKCNFLTKRALNLEESKENLLEENIKEPNLIHERNQLIAEYREHEAALERLKQAIMISTNDVESSQEINENKYSPQLR